MNLNEYFEATEGLGVLGTADADGNVDLAVYGRPHVLDDETIALIMGDRLSHRNLQSNPKAAYLFVETGPGYTGKRLYLTKTAENTDPEAIRAMRRPGHKDRSDSGGTKHLVSFKIQKIRPLVGD